MILHENIHWPNIFSFFRKFYVRRLNERDVVLSNRDNPKCDMEIRVGLDTFWPDTGYLADYLFRCLFGF